MFIINISEFLILLTFRKNKKTQVFFIKKEKGYIVHKEWK